MIAVLVHLEHLKKDVRLWSPIHAPQIHVKGGILDVVLRHTIGESEMENVVATPTVPKAGI